MATENITNLKAARGQTEMQLLEKLTDADAMTQGHTDAIAAAARAAKAMLALDASALTDVRTLLGVIITEAASLGDGINSLAEAAGANWVDQRERDACALLWAQHHALHKTSVAG